MRVVREMADSKFTLGLKLRVRYLLYSLGTAAAYFAIGTVMAGGGSGGYVPGVGFLSHSTGQTIALLCAGGVAVYLQIKGIERAMEFFRHNLIGRGRVNRALFKHRDLVQMDTSMEGNWQSTTRYSLFRDAIPANLYGLGALLAILTLLTKGLGLLCIFYGGACVLLGKLSENYAEHHLCSDEVTEMYENPGSYANVLTQAKQEYEEQVSLNRAQDLLERERRRNRPSPPESDEQFQPPDKPY
jgi:hypothetical protein